MVKKGGHIDPFLTDWEMDGARVARWTSSTSERPERAELGWETQDRTAKEGGRAEGCEERRWKEKEEGEDR